jgi:nucleoid DNA-binding protein
MNSPYQNDPHSPIFRDARDQYRAGGPIRRRHLVTKIANKLDVEEQIALDIVEAIEEAVEESAAANQPVTLPLAGVYPKPRIRSVAANAPKPREPIELSSLATTIASKAHRPVADVMLAFAVISDALEGAPPSIAAYVPGAEYVGDKAALAALERENYELDIQRLHQLGTGIWVLQCNPKKFDVFASRARYGTTDNWAINRYKDEVRKGDRIVFWLSGDESGVYALGEIVGEPFPGVVDERFVLDEDHATWDTYVPIELYIDLFDRPILRSDLKRIPAFASQPIITAPWSANPHPLSTQALEAVLGLLPKHPSPSH